MKVKENVQNLTIEKKIVVFCYYNDYLITFTTMQISENIKKFRELKNITRDKIASELNMSLSNYSKIERGEIDLTLSRITEIAKILEVSILQLMNFDSSQIFNISNNELVQSVGAKSEIINFYGSELQSKYIQNLEDEVKFLKAIIEKKLM